MLLQGMQSRDRCVQREQAPALRITGTNEPLTFLTVNVCGLKTRTVYPEFLQFLSLYDFIGLQETKTDSLDNIQIPGYSIHFKHRKNIAKIKSGGIALA